MSVSIITSITEESNPVFIASSPLHDVTGFKYVCDILDSSGSVVFSINADPNEDGNGVFDITSVDESNKPDGYQLVFREDYPTFN